MRTTIFHKLLFVCILLAGLCACQDDDSEFRPANVEGDGLTLEFVTDPMDKVSVTRASDPKDDDEKRINTLYVFFFGADGNLLDDKVTVGDSDDHSPFAGYAELSRGETTLKIDKAAVTSNPQAGSVTIYAVANISEAEALHYFGEPVDAGNGLVRPANISRVEDLQNIVYRRDEISIGVGDGLPMVGKLSGVDLTDRSSNHAEVEMYSLMARVDVKIQINSDDGDNNLPRLAMMTWEAVNLPKQATFGDPETFDNGTRVTGPLGDDGKATVNTSLQQVIYNRNGEISFSFYMFENIQEKQKPQWPDGVETDGDYPVGVYEEKYNEITGETTITDKRQNYKPYFADKENAANIVLHTYYTDSNNKTYSVDYTLYLGANHTDDFSVKRNHQYKNDITIKGLTQVGTNPFHVTFDARVNVHESGNNSYYLAILRERNLDAHFCVTPMDVYMFGDNNGTSVYDSANDPSIEVILGECPAGSETPDTGTIPEWIAMELVPAADMENGTVANVSTASVESGNRLLATGPYTAGNGKRSWFTTTLVDSLNNANDGHVTVKNSRDRVYFYVDENLVLADRTASVTVIYKEGGVEQRRQTMTLTQLPLLELTYVETQNGGDGRTHTIYMEQIEEYLDHYDPLDEHRTEQVYDGLPWAEVGTELANANVGTLAYDRGWYNDVYNNYYDGLEYTSYVVNARTDQGVMNLNERPKSAFQYCHNKNKRNNQGEVPAQYRFVDRWLLSDYWEEERNSSKWFLPAITQMEKALEEYYLTFPEFQENYYWSASAAKEGSTSLTEKEDGDRARAVLVGGNGEHRPSDQQDGSMYPAGGNALRTEELRIRAFRIDLNPYDY